MQKRPQYRGFAVPFTTFIGSDHIPNFKVTDTGAWHICVDELRCALCGEKLDYWVYYIGSEAHVKGEYFFDMAMHKDCAEYAIQVCPYIAFGKAYGYEIGPTAGAIEIYELAPREAMSNEGVPLFLARGRLSGIRRSSNSPRVTFVKSGTLAEVVPIARSGRKGPVEST
jgi:hypothetical protein